VGLVWNDHAVGIFKNPQDRGKIHAVFGQIGRLLGQVEFQLHTSNVCRMHSRVKTSPPPAAEAETAFDGFWLAMSHRLRIFSKNPPLPELCSSSIRVDLPSFAGYFPPSAIRSPVSSSPPRPRAA
jgi:hypothetical protein